jgi:hypothetical protein
MTVTTRSGAASVEELIAYWCGELLPEREREIEEQLFEDEETSRRLENIVRLGDGIRDLMRSGRLASPATVELLEQLKRANVAVRSYRIGPGEVVPCTIAAEQLMAIRLHGVFEGIREVEVEMRGVLDGEPIPPERLSVPVDQSHAEVVLLYPGERIRALPRSTFTYQVTTTGSGGPVELATFHLDHTPSA